MRKRLPLLVTQRALVGGWLVLLAPVMILLMWQTQAGIYKPAAAVWEWFVPTVMPTLSLLVGVVVANEMQKKTYGTISTFLFGVACLMSFAYISAVTFAVVMAQNGPNGRVDAMRTASLYLGPMQGIASGVLGALFVSTSTAKDAQAATSVRPPPPGTKPKAASKKAKASSDAPAEDEKKTA